MRSLSPSCGALFRCLTAGVALLVACTSQSRLHPPTPEQAVRLDSLKRDPSAVAACAKLSRVDPQAVFLERDVEKPAELLPDQGLPFDRPRREGNAVGVVVVKADGNADGRTVKVASATYFDLGAALAAFLRRARYRPAMIGGQAVAQCLIVPVTVRTRL